MKSPPQTSADKRRKLRFIGTVTLRETLQHVRTPLRTRTPEACDHRPENGTCQPVRRACIWPCSNGHGLCPQWRPVRSWGLSPDANFECTPDSDPNYNSLYRVNTATGAFTRVGSTGAPQFFMDLAFDRNGNMFGVTTTVQPSVVPAILYRIDPAKGAATKIVNLVGSNSVMGLAFGRRRTVCDRFHSKPRSLSNRHRNRF